MRILIVCVLALFTGCAQNLMRSSTVVTPSTAPAVVATLAPLGSFEWAIAPDYTRAISIVRRSTARLALGQLSAEKADAAVALAIQARDKLNDAVRADAATASRLVNEAREHMQDAEKILEAQ